MFFSYKLNILDLLKGSMSLTEVGWCYEKNESSICGIKRA
jgi:hypothetical protein